LTRKNIIARTVSSNNKIVSSRFFEQSNFEQMIMTHLLLFLLQLYLDIFIVYIVHTKTQLIGFNFTNKTFFSRPERRGCKEVSKYLVKEQRQRILECILYNLNFKSFGFRIKYTNNTYNKT
jgi:hypothetical protein